MELTRADGSPLPRRRGRSAHPVYAVARPELAVLADVVAEIGRRGAAILVVGEPGAGVTTLLHAAADRAESTDCTVLTCAGNAAEAGLPFAALHHLLQPVRFRTEALPPVQRHALQTAFALGTEGTPDPFLVALATLSLLIESAASRPVVAVVDNLHWLDRASAEILTFVARRLAANPIVLICGRRQGHGAASQEAPFRPLTLERLDDGHSRRLLADTGVSLSHDECNWVLTQALGNPLALVELSAQVPRTEGMNAAGAPIPFISARLARALLGPLTDLPAITRDALLIAATDETPELSEILAATSTLAGQPSTAAVLDPAEQQHLLRFDEHRITFQHPLLRPAIAQSESVLRRQAAHRAWAATLSEPSPRRTWHRAAAAAGPDDAVADELEAVATAAARIGLFPAAMQALERSAGLTTDRAARVRRLLITAEHATTIADADQVDRLLATAHRSGISGLNRIRAQLIRESPMPGIPDDTSRVARLCDMSEQAAAAGEPDLALKALLTAAQRCWWVATPALQRARVAELADRSYREHPDPRCITAQALAEPIRRGTEVLELLAAQDMPTVEDPATLRFLGLAAHAVGDQRRAADLSARAEEALRRQGRTGALAHALGVGSTARLDLGDWAGAAESSAAGSALAREAGQLIGAAGAAVNQARHSALQGATTAALQQVAEVEYDPLLRALNNFLCRAQIVRGIAWVSAGRPADAFQALRRVFDPNDPSHHEREQIGGIMYLAEAATGCGELVEARRIVADMEGLATVTTSPLLVTHLLYARAVLAPDRDAEQLYLAGLAHDLSAWPWVQARIQLAYGSWLRRQQRKSDSRPPLRAALQTFDQLGARAWSALARGELDATGEPREMQEKTVLAVLSAQELQITRLVAQGLSNAEIGQQLHLSPRTVASHLYRIFPKLDITSRSQIASLLDPQSSGAVI